MTIDSIIAGLGAVAGVLAAALWLWASLVPIPANIDAFIGALQRASRLNAYGAGAAAMAALCATFLFVRQIEL